MFHFLFIAFKERVPEDKATLTALLEYKAALYNWRHAGRNPFNQNGEGE